MCVTITNNYSPYYMEIFKIDAELFDINLTVDSTLITVDSTLITVDATIENSYPYRLRVIPRRLSNNFEVRFENELTKEVTTLDILYYQYIDDELFAYFDFDFEEGDSFEIKIINLNDSNVRTQVMWRGKGYATMQDDLENYRLIVKTNDNLSNNDIIIMP